MKCPKCGKEIADGLKSCPECGADLSQKGNEKHTSSKVHALSIVALVLLFTGGGAVISVILGIIDIIRDKNKEYKHTLSYIAIVVGILIIIGIASQWNTVDDPSSTSAASVSASVSDVAAADSASTAASVVSSEVASTVSSVASTEVSAATVATTEDPDTVYTKLFDDTFSFDYSDFKADYVKDSNILNVEFFTDKTFFNENDLVNSSISYYVAYCNAVYASSDVDEVYMAVKIPMQDAKGNVSHDYAVRIGMPKSEFTTYAWKNLEYKKIYDQFTSSCDKWYCAPGIINQVDTGKIVYQPYN